MDNYKMTKLLMNLIRLLDEYNELAKKDNITEKTIHSCDDALVYLRKLLPRLEKQLHHIN